MGTEEQWTQRKNQVVLSIRFPLSHSVASVCFVYWLCNLGLFQGVELTEMKHYTDR